ncbi:MAG: hypothetical protein LKG48_05105 [Lachnospiraceae bacterium]|jgi:hypothetical protein|nr:hypothetical protein [Lachnospiraceae bacterium]MCH4062907.1 hypothetical protein [Lachnospiraceae bacterium]MCH4104213.1 hypothetical protein [Lachnospiraceae bacterium]MCI1309126.1 hypothetical protein [Lachnospiraceae bacterium]MCI1356961.1 hypothetical protein [Lachnospiraceae bacterium]
MTTGDMCYLAGIVLSVGSLAALVIGNLVYGLKRRKVRRKLSDRYGE